LGPGQILLLVISIGLLGAGVHFEGWQPGPAAFGLAAGSYLILLAAVIGRLPAALDGLSEKRLVAAATVVALAFLVMLALSVPSGLPPRRQIYFLMLGATALLLLAGLFRQGASARWRIPMAIGIFLVLGAWVIVENPAPRIDVWAWHNEALNALLARSQPIRDRHAQPLRRQPVLRRGYGVRRPRHDGLSIPAPGLVPRASRPSRW
jgi:hypothetical protein